MSDDDFLRDLLTDDQPARPAFRAELRDQLSDEWHGRTTIALVDAPPSRPRWWVIAAAAAAVVAIVVTGLVWATRSDDPHTPTVDTRPDTVAPTAPVAVTEACHAGLGANEVVAAFVDDLITARSGTASSLPDCLDQIPADFSGAPPYCWEECAPRLLDSQNLDTAEVADGSGNYWLVELMVSYDLGLRKVDATETWRVERDGVGWAVRLISVRQPDIDRQFVVDTINRYLAAIDSGDWLTAADMLDVCGVALEGVTCSAPESLDERWDLQRIGVDQPTDESIAAALERWCADGCDTTPVRDVDLTFFHSYSVTRAKKTIRVDRPSSDSAYFLYGAPFRTAPMTRAVAGWPQPSPSDPQALDDVPYLLPTGSIDGASKARRSEKVGGDGSPHYEQWFVDPTSSRAFSVVTAGDVNEEGQKRDVYLPDWDRAYVYPEVPDGKTPSVLRLDAGDQVVTVQGDGYTEDELIDIGRNLVPRPAGTAGWDIAGLASTTVPYGEGWTIGGAHTTVSWTDGERSVAHLDVDAGSPVLVLDGRPTFADVNGAIAMVRERADGRSSVYWQPAPGVYATFEMVGSAEATLEVARGFHEVTRQAWEDYATPT